MTNQMHQFPVPAELRHPLRGFNDGAFDRTSHRPIPLIATRIEARVIGGLGVVRTELVFTNAEAAPIEATYTFPVPVHATLARLTAQIGDRSFLARARQRDAARAAYEAAIDTGRTAVLHEEVMPGLHMLSIGPIPPAVQITVASTWAMPLQPAKDGRALLRIPTTMSHMYGNPPMPDSDAPLREDVCLHADLQVICDSGQARLAGAALVDGRAQLPLDRPIDIEVAGWMPALLRGRAANGCAVTLECTQAEGGEAPLDLALLIDRSSSMGYLAATADGQALSTHDVVLRGLVAADALLRPGDRVAAWQFNDRVEPVVTPDGRLSTLALVLGKPDRGTEIGQALQAVIQQSDARDILMVTDGESYALDVQALARSGRRISVVLVGRNGFSGKAGHLAALTGGEIFVAGGADAGTAMYQAIASLRRPHSPFPALEARPDRSERLLSGMRVKATWTKDPVPQDDMADIVGAVAAALVLPSLPAAEAARIAEEHGLVSHLTSLVLVDDAGDVQATLPSQRRVPLMTQHLAAGEALSAAAGALFDFNFDANDERIDKMPPPRQRFQPDSDIDYLPAFAARSRLSPALPATTIDWGSLANTLLQGDLSRLPRSAADKVRRIAVLPEIVSLSANLGQPSIVVALALIAMMDTEDRNAMRFARRVIPSTERPELIQARAIAAAAWHT